jgi:hypothetical protein
MSPDSRSLGDLAVIRTFVILVGIGVFADLQEEPAIAGDETSSVASALRAVNDIPWSQMTVKIVDTAGVPIPNAIVRPWALRAGKGHGVWQETMFGSPPRSKTDAQGEAVVTYPVSVDWGEPHPVVQVSMIVVHDDYCSTNSHVDIPKDDPPSIPQLILEPGVQIRVAGVEPGGDQPLSDCHLLIENSETAEPEFKREPAGWLRSTHIRQGRRWFRVVRTPPGEPAQFSKPMAWSPDDPASREIRAEIRPGVRLSGTLSDAVPRPILRGHVVAWCGSPNRNHADGQPQDSRPIWWIDSAPIREDGTFVFSSLPSGYLVQLYALANDSISSQPSDAAFETCCKWFGVKDRQRIPSFRGGQILRLSGGESRITLEMETAGQVRVKCVDDGDRGLPGVLVSAWPNQFIVGAGSTVFCMRNSTLDQLRDGVKIDMERGNPFAVKTNANGEAVITNLPAGRQSLYAANEHWKCTEEIEIESRPAETATFTITLKRQP